jgi:hypothetical protein
LKEDIEKALGIQGEDLTHKDQDIISMMLYVKDRYNISGSAYRLHYAIRCPVTTV